MKSILIICTGNSCRSQMAEGWLKSFGNDLEVFSAGTYPSTSVNRRAVEVMSEAGVDIGKAYPKSVDQFLQRPLDYVITVCDDANERCPVFTGTVGKRLHTGFDDPSFVEGSEEEVMAAFRKTRDEIRDRFRRLYEEELR